MSRNPSQTAYELAEQALKRLAGEIGSGRTELFAAHLAAMSRLRDHSWRNVLLVATQRPNATQVRSLHAWNDLGRRVKSGEKGILIFSPATASREPLAGGVAFKAGSVRSRSDRVTYAFDVSQTEGKSIPPSSTVELHDFQERLRSWMVNRDIVRDAGNVAPAPLTESLTAKDTAEVSSLAREFAQAMLPSKSGGVGDSPEVRQVQVQAAAHVFMGGLGMAGPDVTVDSRGLRGCDLDTLAQSLAVIQATSNQMRRELFPEERIGPIASGPQERFRLDTDRFAQLQREYGKRLIYNLDGMVRDRQKAEEIAAKAFDIAWEKRETFRGESQLSTWVEAIARNEARHAFRIERAHEFESIDSPVGRELAAPDHLASDLERQEDRKRLQLVLDSLPDRYREALVAHFIDGLSVRDIARRESIPVGTVLSRIHSGKQLVREGWEQSVRGLPPEVQAPLPTPLTPQKSERIDTESRNEFSGDLTPADPIIWDR